MTDQKLHNAIYLRSSPALEFKFDGSAIDAGAIEGIASPFGGEPDSYGDLIAPGAYTRSLAEHSREGSMPAMLWQHDTSVPIGRWLEMRQDAGGLFVRGKLNLETEPGTRAHAHLRAGDIRGLSIGFAIYDDGYVQNRNGTRTLTAIDLREVSLVTMAAARRAAVTAVKSFSSRSELRSILRESLPSRAVEKLLSDGWSAFGREDEDLTPELEMLAKRIDAARLTLKKEF